MSFTSYFLPCELKLCPAILGLFRALICETGYMAMSGSFVDDRALVAIV